MTVSPLIIVAVALLLAFAAAGLWWRHRRGVRRAVPPGPRTVAELVSQRASADSPVLAEPQAEVVAHELPVPAPVEAAPVSAPPEPVPAVPEREPAAKRDVPAVVDVDPRPVAPLGEDLPWRRAAHITGGRADPAPAPETGRVPALALLPRPVRPGSAPTASAVVENPARPTVVPPAPAADEQPVPAPPPADPEPAPRPHDPSPLAAEQAAADLALLRTFGPADLGSRPDRAPVVALEGRGRPAADPIPGAEQPVRFRAVRRDGTALPDVAVALLDDHGREVGVDKADAAGTGEVLAPHPGSYVLVATAPDHQPGAVTLTVDDGPVDAEVLLVRSASLAGLVGGEDGPIEGARVTLVQDGEIVETADTDPDGRYQLPDMAAGEYALSVAAAGCAAHVVLVTVPDETAVVHDVELDPAGPLA